MQEKNITGAESLDLIQSMINRAKNQFGENGHLYLVWGYVVLFCSVTQFILNYFFAFEKHYLVWLLTWLALFYQIFYLAKNKKMKKVKTYTSDILGQVWLVFAVLMVTIGFIMSFIMQERAGIIYTPVILCLYGMPSYLSGKIIRFTPLVIGGISCWVLSMVSLTVPVEFQMLFYGVAVIIAWIVPGYLLKKKYNSESHE